MKDSSEESFVMPGDLVKRRGFNDEIVLVIDTFDRPVVWGVGIGKQVETNRKFFRGLSNSGVTQVYDQSEYVRMP